MLRTQRRSVSWFLEVVLVGGGILVFLGLLLPAHAQEHPLTFDEALSLALERNPDLAVERKVLDLARGELTRARLYPFNPELAVEPGFGRERALENGHSRFAYDVQIGVSQVVELKGQRGLRLQRARATADQAKWRVKDAERGVRAKVVKAFSGVRLAQERVKLASEIVVLARELARVAQELFEAGAVPRLDVLRAEVELRRAMNALTAAERELATLKRDLTLLMGQPSGVEYQAVGPLVYQPLEGDLGRLTARALESRPDLKAVEAGLKGAEAEVALVRAGQVFPALTLSARYELGREIDVRTQRAVLGLSLPLPLFTRRQGELEIAFAERARQAARVKLVRARIEKEVPQAFERFRSSQQIVEQFTKRILPQQEENFHLLREGYQLGQFSLTDVLVIQREFIEGRLGYLDALSEFNEALADLEEAIGIGLIETGGRP